MARKYWPLMDYLIVQRGEAITLTRDQIERILGAPLPASAARPAWWANTRLGNGPGWAWLRAGWRVASMRGDAVTFVRQGPPGRLPPYV